MTVSKQLEQANAIKYEKNGIVGVFTRKHISTRITALVCRTELKPNHITIISLLIGILATYFLSTGERINLLIAGILIFFSKVLDAVDGEVARVKKLETKMGAWLDGISDRLKENLYFFGIALGLYNQTGNVMAWYYAFIAVISVHMLSIVLEHTGIMDKGMLKSTHGEFWLVRLVRKLGIKPQYIALRADTYLFFFYVGVLFNQLVFVLWFFMIVVNLYWLAIAVLVYKKSGAP